MALEETAKYKLIGEGKIPAVKMEIGEEEIHGHKGTITTEIYTHVSRKNPGKIVSPMDAITLNKEDGGVTMFIKLKDFVCSSIGSISALSADITPEWHHISTKSADITKLSGIAALPVQRYLIFGWKIFEVKQDEASNQD